MKVKRKDIKRVWNKWGSRQIINSPHKTFNKLTNVIDNSGNMIASTQNSHYIRPYNETECNGFINEKGHLQDFDLKYEKDEIKRKVKESETASYWIGNFYIHELFCTMLVNLETMELTIFDYSTNYKQRELINWLIDYLFEKE